MAVITGANSGIGFFTARELARADARVILACRSAEKGEEAVRAHQTGRPGRHRRASVPRPRQPGVGPGVRGPVRRGQLEDRPSDQQRGGHGAATALTSDGFELQFGTNHLGHFALTGRLFGLINNNPGARVVNVSSGAHRRGRMVFDDLQGERSYGRWSAYGQSKLANLLFTFELDRRLRASASPALAVAAHPGYAATNLQTAVAPAYEAMLMSFGNMIFAQSAEMGALPRCMRRQTERSRAVPTSVPGVCSRCAATRTQVDCSAAAGDKEAARTLWAVSEELTGVQFAQAVASTA